MWFLSSSAMAEIFKLKSNKRKNWGAKYSLNFNFWNVVEELIMLCLITLVAKVILMIRNELIKTIRCEPRFYTYWRNNQKCDFRKITYLQSTFNFRLWFSCSRLQYVCVQARSESEQTRSCKDSSSTAVLFLCRCVWIHVRCTSHVRTGVRGHTGVLNSFQVSSTPLILNQWQCLSLHSIM